MPISKARRDLLIRLEAILGKHAWNDNIQNYGFDGEFEDEGRQFRYPLRFQFTEDWPAPVVESIDGQRHLLGEYWRCHVVPDQIPDERLLAGYYAFGANEFYVFRALDRIVDMLVEEYDLKIERVPSPEDESMT